MKNNGDNYGRLLFLLCLFLPLHNVFAFRPAPKAPHAPSAPRVASTFTIRKAPLAPKVKLAPKAAFAPRASLASPAPTVKRPKGVHRSRSVRSVPYVVRVRVPRRVPLVRRVTAVHSSLRWAKGSFRSDLAFPPPIITSSRSKSRGPCWLSRLELHALFFCKLYVQVVRSWE